MAEKEVQITKSQVAGGVLGAAVGNFKGTSVGMTACMATVGLLGPLSLFLVPAGALLGTYVGAKVGSKGVSRAVLMGLGTALPSGGAGGSSA